MKKVARIGFALAGCLIGVEAMSWDRISNARIQQYDAYGLGNHMDQYGRSVTIQPDNGNWESNTFNRIERYDAYGPGKHMDQYGRPVTVQPSNGYQGKGQWGNR